MNILVLGANSDIAYAIAKKFAGEKKAGIYLASREMKTLQKKIKDLEIRFDVCATALSFDALAYDSHQAFYDTLNPKPDGVILAFGYLGDQEKAQREFKEAQKIIETNFTGSVSILEIVAADFQQRGKGFIIGIGSVAGERGRQSNYIYGSAKGAFSLYLSGLRNRLFSKNIHVMTVLPGFVQTKMTDHMDLPEILTALPEEVAENVYSAFKKSKNIIYTKWIWRWIMAIITHIPEFLFKRMKL